MIQEKKEWMIQFSINYFKNIQKVFNNINNYK